VWHRYLTRRATPDPTGGSNEIIQSLWRFRITITHVGEGENANDGGGGGVNSISNGAAGTIAAVAVAVAAALTIVGVIVVRQRTSRASANISAALEELSWDDSNIIVAERGIRTSSPPPGVGEQTPSASLHAVERSTPSSSPMVGRRTAFIRAPTDFGAPSKPKSAIL
jgi:hypothetical protein